MKDKNVELSERQALLNVKYDKGSAPRKIDFKKLASELLTNIDDVEKADIKQGLKTSRYKALAQKFKNALYNDKRKYRGKKLDKRISLKTYANYLSRVRKLFDDRLHHSFFKEINKLSISYPAYADLFKSWENKKTSTIRVELIELQTKLKNGLILIEKYKPNSKNTVLIKTYPEWKKSIERQTIIDEVEDGRKLLNDLDKIKVNHEIMYHLTLDATEKSAIKMKVDDSLRKKKRNTISINYPAYMSELFKILNLPNEAFLGLTRKSIDSLAFALAATSGRRMIEILSTGEVKRISKYKIAFTGQAKKRSGDEDIERSIYTLVDSSLFIKKLRFLRESPALSDLSEILSKNSDDQTKTDNIKINNVFHTDLNNFAKRFFNDKNRVFKDTRAIYARIVYEKYFKTDKRWNNVDEDVFFAEILGHDDEETQLHYKQFKLENFDPNFTPELGENTRLEALKELDNDMPGLARQGSAVKIHEWVKEQVSINPDANITTYSIRKAVPVKPTVVARYLDHVADALGLVKENNGRYERVNEDNVAVIVETGSIDDESVKEETTNINQKDIKTTAGQDESEEPPQFTAMQLINKDWLVQFKHNGEPRVWTGKAANMGDAINKAWEVYNKK